MKKFFASLALLFVLLAEQPVKATTAYYQPTPFPNSVESMIPEASRHFTEGWIQVDSNFIPVQLNGTTLQQDDWLYVGGETTNVRYISLLKFDLVGLPRHVDSAIFWFVPGSVSSPWSLSPYAACAVASQWNGVSTWSVLPQIAGSCIGWYPAPTANSWAYVWASSNGCSSCGWYNAWQDGSLVNNGILLFSENSNYALDGFIDSRYSPPYDGSRPQLALTFTQPVGMPQFKMPVPGGTSWLLSNEVGGYDCTGSSPWPDTAHQCDNYFSLDITWNNKGGMYGKYNTPILAAAGGTVNGKARVVDIGSNTDSRGYYITLDHGNGYQTRYLHLQGLPARKNGALLSINDLVSQGDQIGIMGQTGSAGGVHVHINFWVNGIGTANSNLSYATMEGLLLKSYQTECSGSPLTWIRYYSSTNTPTGN